ncbi:MAG: hypothetical protein MUP02_07755 [Actinobacteria bacterium]|nr:hypothetical protein [Actinomycetota bacterium]
MSKNEKNIRDDEMWCPECGAPIKKGFFTCANCKLKVRLTEDINEKQTMKKKSKSSKSASEPKKSIEKKKNIPETEKSSKSAQGSTVTDKEKKELLDDIFEEDAGSLENLKSGSRPGGWSYS